MHNVLCNIYNDNISYVSVEYNAIINDNDVMLSLHTNCNILL